VMKCSPLGLLPNKNPAGKIPWLIMGFSGGIPLPRSRSADESGIMENSF
jgi:hypothetical protein